MDERERTQYGRVPNPPVHAAPGDARLWNQSRALAWQALTRWGVWWSRARLAQALGLPPATWYAWDADRVQRLDGGTLGRICWGLGVAPGAVLTLAATPPAVVAPGRPAPPATPPPPAVAVFFDLRPLLAGVPARLIAAQLELSRQAALTLRHQPTRQLRRATLERLLRWRAAPSHLVLRPTPALAAALRALGSQEPTAEAGGLAGVVPRPVYDQPERLSRRTRRCT